MKDLRMNIKISADGKQAVVQVGDLRESVHLLDDELNKNKLAAQAAGQKIENYGKKAVEASDSTNRLTRGLKSIGQQLFSLRNLIASVSLVFLITQSVTLADQFNVLQSRIQTATKKTNDYVQVSKELFRVSQENGTALKSTVSLFQNLSRSRQDLKATNKEFIQLTDIVQKLGVISGATNEQLSNGLLQFSQGLSAGIFRAEEFNSIVENIPEVAFRIADGMNMTAGQLRQAVVDGNVLSRDVFDSLMKQTQQINPNVA